MRQLLEQDAPDVDAVMRQAEVIGEVDVRKHKHRIATMLEIRAKLTPEQRTQLRQLKAEMRERRGELRQQVTTWTGQHAFVVDDVLKGMMVRCRELGLRVAHGERETGEGAAILVTLHTVRIQRMRHRAYFR